jgi:predicted esterase
MRIIALFLIAASVGGVTRAADRPASRPSATMAATRRSATMPGVTTTQESERSRLNRLAQIDLKFKPGVFAGDAFPPCDFADAGLAHKLIGPYTLRATFYDAEYQAAEKPTKAGRYGAVVEVVTEAGLKIPPRLVTIFRQNGPAEWDEEQFKVRVTKLPPQAGIDPKVVREQAKAIGEQALPLLRDALLADVETPQLLAALAECKPGDPPLAGRNSIWARDERWWYPLKRRLGRARYEYRVDWPRDYDRENGPPLPLLLFLHGSGERGDDLERVRVHGPVKVEQAGRHLPFLIVSPQCPAGEWWSAAQLKDLLDEVEAKYRVDADRVFVTGLSMGGYGTWELAAECPERFAAIAPICGAGGVADAPRLKDLPAWVFHGQQDRSVPFQRSAEMVKALRKAGGRVRFTKYPDRGHDSWTPTYENPELYEWLLKQKRGALPEPVSKPPTRGSER